MSIFGAIGSLIGAGAGLYAGQQQNSTNLKAVRETNAANKEINQMNNNFNAAMADRQMQFQEDMWNKQNEYNTPSAQRERLSAAGLNPYLMMDGSSAGVATSSPQGSSVPASSAAPQVAGQIDNSYVGSSIQNALSFFLQSKMNDAGISQLQGQKNLADAQAMDTLSRIDWGKLTSETRDYLKQTGLSRAQLGYAREQQEMTNLSSMNRLIQAQGDSQLLDAEAKTILNKYLDSQQQADLQVKASSYYQQMAHGHLSYNEAKKVLAEEILTYAKANGQRISNRVADATADGLISASNANNHAQTEYSTEAARQGKINARNDAWDKYWDAMNKKRDYNSKPWLNGSSVLKNVGNAIGSFIPGK